MDEESIIRKFEIRLDRLDEKLQQIEAAKDDNPAVLAADLEEELNSFEKELEMTRQNIASDVSEDWLTDPEEIQSFAMSIDSLEEQIDKIYNAVIS
ncbi:MAG TPA: hypothetical protein VGA67_04605 [Candidatus Dojkabacteria bacterium]|jgi:hypothetical protein